MANNRMILVDRVLEILDQLKQEARPPANRNPSCQLIAKTINKVRARIQLEVEPPQSSTERRPHVTPIGDGIGVKPLGSPDPVPYDRSTSRVHAEALQTFRQTGEFPSEQKTRKSAPKLKYAFGPTGSVETVALTPGQREALRTVATKGPSYRDQICPRRFLSGATLRSLVNKDLLQQRNYPVVGYQLTERGKAVVAALTKED